MAINTQRYMASLKKPRTWVLLGVSLAVLVIAILVGSALAPSDEPSVPPAPGGEPSPSVQAAPYVEQAQSALTSGDTTKAASLARQALAVDPDNKSASEIVAKARKQQQTSSTDPSTGGSSDSSKATPAAAIPGEFLGDIKNLSVLLPKSFDRFIMGDATQTREESQITATPKSSSEPATQITWTVHRFEDAKAATAFIAKTSKQLFSHDSAQSTVDGVSAYFGTDGARYATVAYARGRYVFELLLASNGVPPKNDKALALSAAKAFSESAK